MFLGAEALTGWQAWALSLTSLASHRGHPGAQRPRSSPSPARAVPGWAHPTGDLRAEDPAQEAAEPWPGGVARAAQPVAHGWATTAARSRCPFIAAELRSSRPPLSAWPLVAQDNKQGGANCLGLCIPLSGDNKDRDPDSPLQHLPCLLFSLPLTKFTQEDNSFLPSLYEGRR